MAQFLGPPGPFSPTLGRCRRRPAECRQGSARLVPRGALRGPTPDCQLRRYRADGAALSKRPACRPTQRRLGNRRSLPDTARGVSPVRRTRDRCGDRPADEPALKSTVLRCLGGGRRPANAGAIRIIRNVRRSAAGIFVAFRVLRGFLKKNSLPSRNLLRGFRIGLPSPVNAGTPDTAKSPLCALHSCVTLSLRHDR